MATNPTRPIRRGLTTNPTPPADQASDQAGEQTTTDPAATGLTLPAVKPGGFVPKIKKLVTLPVLTMKAGETYYLKFLSRVELSKVKQQPDKDGKTPEPAHVAQVVMLDTGEPRNLIVNAVLVSVLDEEYKDHSYVNKGFQIEVLKPKDGKRYKGFSVAELELE